jgi:hypothetical protein
MSMRVRVVFACTFERILNTATHVYIHAYIHRCMHAFQRVDELRVTRDTLLMTTCTKRPKHTMQVQKVTEQLSTALM